MAHDEVTRMARDAGFQKGWTNLWAENLERFAALVAAAEREACAKVCDDNHWEDHRLFADAIRARGQK